MIFPNSKALLQCAVLTVALWPTVVLGSNENDNNSESWVHRVRGLQEREFQQVCNEVFLSEDHLQKTSYFMSDYAEEVTDLCLKFAPNSDQGTCRENSFGSLGASFQNAFFTHAAHQLGRDKLPISALMSMGNVGYIVSDKTALELNTMRNDLCVELHGSIGDAFISQIPEHTQTKPIMIRVPESTEATEPATKPKVTATNTGDTGNNNNQSFTITEVEEDHPLSIGAIIGISCAVSLIIALFFYGEARRREQGRSRRARNRKQGLGGDGVIKVSTSSVGSFSTTSSGSSSVAFTPFDEIKGAINNADWDHVYKLASRLAEADDGLSLPSIGSFRGQSRSHLAAEDQERTKTLDDLASNGDWTGLAVTAALYAGETSGSSHEHPDTCSYGADEPSPRRGTVRLPSFIRSSRRNNQDIEEGQSSMEEMVGGLSQALNAGDWSQVNYFASKIKDQKGGNSFDTDSQAFVLSSTSSIVSTNTTDTEFSKKQTIEKLMRAGKWKGVSIMANMYEMESKQNSSSSSVQPYPTSPTHPYTDNRTFRTKELRHADRVQENINGFRQDP